MKKILFMLIIAVSLSGCEVNSGDVTDNYVFPSGLKDCSIFRVDSPTKQPLMVVRCPMSTTGVSYMSGKVRGDTSTTETIEDFAKIQQEKKQAALAKLTEEDKKLLGVK